MPTTDVSTREKLLVAFDARMDTIDFEKAKEDVLPYLKDRTEVDIWSREFFKEYIRRIIIKGEQA